MVCSPYRINLDVRYDGGYAARFTNPSDRIESHMSALQEYYLNMFNVVIDISTPETFQSLADSCANEDYMDKCECGSCHESGFNEDGSINYITIHHKNITNNIYQQIQSPITTRRMLFIGHRLCQLDAWDGCVDVSSKGIAWEPYNICAIYSFNSMQDELLAVLHEFGHLIGADDHYGTGNVNSTEEMNGEDENKPFNTFCIYGEVVREDAENHTQLVNNPVICDGCRAMIQTYLMENCV